MTRAFDQLVEVVLPRGGYLMAVAEAYFDESGTHDGAPFICVAGYIFEAEAAREFSAKWNSALSEYDLPYFHAVDCVSQNGVFSHLTDGQCDKLTRKLIALIKEHMSLGIATSVDRATYAQIMPRHPWLGDDYQFCGARMLEGARRSLERLGISYDKISFFFEAGHDSQGALGRVIYDLMSSDENRAFWKYQSHSFVGKRDAPPIQAADFLAWQTAKLNKCIYVEGRKPRADFLALIDGSPHIIFHAGRDVLLQVVRNFLEAGHFGEDQGFSQLRPSLPPYREAHATSGHPPA